MTSRPSINLLILCAAVAAPLLDRPVFGDEPAAVLPTGARAALSAPKFVLLLPGRPPEPIALLRIDAPAKDTPGTITYLDASGARQSKNLDDIVALAPSIWSPVPENTAESGPQRTSGPAVHRVTLVDGQRLSGELVSAPPGGDASASVHLRHDRLGVLAFPIDRVSRYEDDVQLTLRPTTPLSTSADTVLLMNGDVMEGFVATLGPTVTIEPSATPGGKRPPAIEVGLGQVGLVQLVNPPVVPTGARLDLSDGSMIIATDVAAQLESAKLSFRPALAPKDQDPISLDLTELAGLVPNAERLVPLASLPISAQQAALVRPGDAQAHTLTSAPAPLDATDILLPSPMTVDWALPEKITSVSGFAQMDDRSFVWGDCVVTVLVVDRAGQVRQEIANARLNAQNPTLGIAGAINAKPGDRLRVSVDPGERGPVQDRIVLRRMLLVRGSVE